MASRRAGERLILAGRVAVDGRVTTELGSSVEPGVQTVTVDGIPVAFESRAYVLFNKPRNVVCTNRDPQGRPTFRGWMPELAERVFSVGRLDMDSEGLLLLTNDGELAQRLAHPSHHAIKQYRVWTDAELPAGAQARMTGPGMLSRGERLRARVVAFERRDPAGWCYAVELGEGRNRQIRRMCEAAGVQVLRLLRVSLGPLTLGDLKPGAWRRLTPAEAAALRAAAGLGEANEATECEPDHRKEKVV